MRQSYFLATAATLVLSTLSGCSPSTESTSSDESIEVPAAVQTVNFANTKCPIMGGKPTAELTAQYEGGTIGFCCEGCPEKWAALSAEAKAEKFAKVSSIAGSDHEPSSLEEHTGGEVHDVEGDRS